MRLLLPVCLLLASVLPLNAQQLPTMPPPEAAQQAGPPCEGECNLPPEIVYVAPGSTAQSATPEIIIEWCDPDGALDASTRYVELNGTVVTSSFSYSSSGYSGSCSGDAARSTSTSLTLVSGWNTFSSIICDDLGACSNYYHHVYLSPASPGAPVVTLRNHNADVLDRGQCLTVGAGQSAGLSCGDLFVAHSMPAYSTLGRDRQLTLFYNSETAAPRPSVAATIAQPTNIELPQSVHAELKINAGAGFVTYSSATYSGWTSASRSRQVVLGYDASAHGSGIYAFQLVVTNNYAGGPQSTTISGTILVVNRRSSEFGAGWWPLGIERITLNAGQLFWLGGDGSAAAYDSIGPSAWVRRAAAFRDTIIRIDTTYVRYLRHGVQVHFNLAGQHIRTVNRAGQATTMTWSAASGLWRLTRITVPTDSLQRYDFIYTQDAAQSLDYVRDPASRSLDLSIGSPGAGAPATVLQIVDPDQLATSFGYEGSGRLTSRTNRRGNMSRWEYGNDHHVTRTTLPVGRTTADTATSVTTYEWWDEKGLAICSVSCSRASADTSTSYTRVFGPRPNVADDQTFWMDRWGIARMQNALGHVTTVARGNPNVPSLPTRITRPDGAIDSLAWDARANLITSLDSTSHLTNGLASRRTQWLYQSDSTKDSPSRVTGPDGLNTNFTYNSLGLLATSTEPTGRITSYRYRRSGALTGALDSVIEHQVLHYDSASGYAESTSDIAWRFAYNDLGNLIGDTTPMGRRRTLNRDSHQRVNEVIDGAGHRTTLVYDVMNRVTDSYVHVQDYPADPGFSSPLHTHYRYTNDVLEFVADPRGVRRSYEYDRSERVIGELDEAGVREETFYDAAGLVSAVRPRSDPDSTIRMSYDAANQMTVRSWRRRYNLWAGAGAGWLPSARITTAADSVVFGYDVRGRMTSATTRDWVIERQYFATGDLKREIQRRANGQDPRTVNYGYDASGRRAWYVAGTMGVAANSDSIWYRYQAGNGQLHRVGVRWRNSVTDSVTFGWDKLGRRQSVQYTNGALVTMRYDADGSLRLMCGAHPNSSVTDDVFSFTHQVQWIDADGMVRRITNTPQLGAPDCGYNTSMAITRTFRYDKRHELTQIVESGGDTTSYTYDGSGNQTRRRRFRGATVHEDRGFAYPNGSNRLSQSFNWIGSDYVNHYYYADGGRGWDLSSLGATHLRSREFVYDGLGRTNGTIDAKCNSDGTENGCVSFSWSATNAEGCGFDGLGRLLRSCDQLFLPGYDGQNVIRTGPDASTADWSLVHGPGLDDPVMGLNSLLGHRIYYVTDGQGREYAVGDRTGNNYAANSQYMSGAQMAGGTRQSDSFGARRQSGVQPYRLSFFRNRFYDQESGRFTQEDPIGVAGGLNLYSYAANNPVTFTDPFGLCIPMPWCLQAATQNLGNGLRSAADVVVGLTPGLSTAQDAVTVATGTNPVTQQDVGVLGQGVALAGLLTPASGGSIRAGAAAVKSFLGNSSAWKRIGAFVEAATNRRARGGSSIQEIFENAGGDRVVQHTVVDRTGRVIDGPHPRPAYKPREGEVDP